METRVAVISILVSEGEGMNDVSVSAINDLLHEYGGYIIGRMGIPYHVKKVSIISVALDAPQEIISALSGKLGRLSGVSVKTAYTSC